MSSRRQPSPTIDQNVQVSNFIRVILQSYLFGPQVVVEFLQNADDAKATKVRMGVDERDVTLPPTEAGLRGLQGPAFWVYNDRIFADSDWESISNIGRSVKAGDATKIGRFCLVSGERKESWKRCVC